MSEWKEYKLKDVCDLIVDCVNRTAPTVDYTTPYKMIRTTNVKSGKIDIYDVRYVTEDTYKNWVRRAKPQKGDIVLTREAPVGEIGLIRTDDNLFLGQRTMMYRANKSISNPLFLYYSFLTSFLQEQILAAAMGSVVEHIRVPDAKEFIIRLPPLPEQTAIATVLSNLDEKIDLLHRQNKTLEALAEILFRQWFVEEASVDTAEDSWEVGVLGDLVDFNPKRTLSKGTTAPYLEMSNVSSEVYHPHSWYDREFTSGTKFINGDTLFARITPCLENGKTAYVDFLDKNQVGWGSTEFIVMRAKEPIHPYFSYLLARNEDFRSYAIGGMVGSSGRQRADVSSLANFEMFIPPKEVVERFNSYIESTLKKMKSNHLQVRTLTQLRDTLLPKLMSGEVRVEM
ncbi:restriction endonuclease subunit S [Telluribacter sp.]|jgi:type I restriction enzyme S subunit|uniref:restriction endonuclease subunit S n=1 Tax=Telluribacter sp. TaxID=1978767 RepID=UPI002E167480|nr:restriction endonuclease subunit S [Telluribacter sp.]